MNLWHPMRGDGITFRVDYNIEWQATDLYIANRRPNGLSQIALPIEWVEHNPGDMFQPALRLRDCEGPNSMQHLFNALWDAGFRPPKEVINVDAVVKAKDDNLADLRRILNKVMESSFDGC